MSRKWQSLPESNRPTRIQSPAPLPLGQGTVILITIAAIIYYLIFAFLEV